MKHFIFSLSLMLFTTNPVLASEQKVLFEGLNAKIVSVVDDMTDEKSEAIFVDFGEIYMGIYGHDSVTIWADSDDLNFSFDDTHLIRVGENKPFSLVADKRNALHITNSIEAEAVIRSLAKGEEIKLRYYNWPQHDKVDRKLQHSRFGFVYNKAVELFGWKDLGVSGELGPAKLNVYASDVDVINNRFLSLHRRGDTIGGGAEIQIYLIPSFGVHDGSWVSGSANSDNQQTRLIIRDKKGSVVFNELFPSYSARLKSNSYYRWPASKTAAKKAWDNAPLGSIEIEGLEYDKRLFLYGFKELWKWGVDNADFPSLE